MTATLQSKQRYLTVVSFGCAGVGYLALFASLILAISDAEYLQNNLWHHFMIRNGHWFRYHYQIFRIADFPFHHLVAIALLSSLIALLLARSSWYRVRQMRSPGVVRILASDARPPVLYLRSFQDDSLTLPWSRWLSILDPLGRFSASRFEEEVVRRAGEYGPVIAFGRPDEELPPLGAARGYADAEAWQDSVRSFIALSSSRSRSAVPLVISPGAGRISDEVSNDIILTTKTVSLNGDPAEIREWDQVRAALNKLDNAVLPDGTPIGCPYARLGWPDFGGTPRLWVDHQVSVERLETLFNYMRSRNSTFSIVLKTNDGQRTAYRCAFIDLERLPKAEPDLPSWLVRREDLNLYKNRQHALPTWVQWSKFEVPFITIHLSPRGVVRWSNGQFGRSPLQEIAPQELRSFLSRLRREVPDRRGVLFVDDLGRFRDVASLVALLDLSTDYFIPVGLVSASGSSNDQSSALVYACQ